MGNKRGVYKSLTLLWQSVKICGLGEGAPQSGFAKGLGNTEALLGEITAGREAEAAAGSSDSIVNFTQA